MWKDVYQRAFLLHVPTRPQIIITYQWRNPLVLIELGKQKGWDIAFVAWLIPFQYHPGGGKAEGRWRRLYLGKQYFELTPQDMLGSLEIRPRLWVPDLTVKVSESTVFQSQNQQILDRLAAIEQLLRND
jgi:hypothetical protein